MPYPFVPGEVLTAANLNAALNQRMMADGTGLAFTPGAVLFGASTGKFATDSANIFFDDTNNRLGIQTNTPQAMLQVGKTAATARAYNSYTDPANGEWSYLGDWGPPLTNAAVYGSDRNGTGIARDVVFVRGGVEMLRLAAGGLTAPGSIAQTQPVPVMLGSTAQAGTSRGVAVSGNYAYATIAATVQTLEIFDITVPTAPTKIGGLDLPATAVGQPVVAGQIVYVGVNSNTAGIQIIDVSNPKAPTVIRSLNAGGVAIGSLALSGPYLYVGQAGAGTNFRVWDVSDPANPVAKSALFPLAGAAGIISIAVQGKYAFAAANQAVVGTGGLYVIDVSDPANPVLVSTYNAASSGRGVTVAGKYLYLTASVAASGLEVVDISDPTLPVLVKLFATTLGGGSSVNPVVAGNYLFLGNNSGSGLQTVSIADPANPVAIGTTATGAVLGLSISGNKLYVTTSLLLRVLDTFGIDTPSARAGALSTDTLNVDGASYFAGDIFAQRGLVVGQTGINARGQVTGGTVRSVGNAFLATASIGTLNTAQAMLHVGGSAGTARVYNSYTDTANGEWSYLGDFGPPLTNVASYGTGKNGTGASRAVAFVVGDVEAARFDTTGCLLIGATSGTSGMLNVLGSYTTAQLTLMYNNATLNSSNTGGHYGFWNRPIFNPTGASLTNVFALSSTPQMSAGSVLTITNFACFQSQLQTAAGYAGTLATGTAFLASNPSILGTNPITNCYGFWQNGISNGNGATTGTIVNRGVYVSGVNAGSAGAAITNYAAHVVTPSGGASAGTTTNYGIYISSNGGTASGGTVTNYALYSDSTAPALISGMLLFNGITTAFPALKRNAAALEVRLANDSGYANLTAGWLGLNGQVATMPLDIRNTFTSATEASVLSVTSTLRAAQTLFQSGAFFGATLQPTGATLALGAAVGISHVLAGTVAINQAEALWIRTDLAGYTGANLLYSDGIRVVDTIGGSAIKYAGRWVGVGIDASTNGHGSAVAGGIANIGVSVDGATSGAAVGGLILNRGVQLTVPSGSGAGTTVNTGLFITGNGGAVAAGTSNYAIYSDSAAPSLLTGLLVFGGTTTAFPALKRNAAALEVRLANDSAYANLTAQYLGLNGQIPTVPLDLRGTFTTSVEAVILNLATTIASTVTGSVYGASLTPGFQPSGASLTYAAGLTSVPRALGSVAIAEISGIAAGVDITGYTGANIVNGEGIYIGTPLGISATKRISVYCGVLVGPIANGQGITTGSVANYGVGISGPSASPAAGGTIENTSENIIIPNGSGAGITSNIGLHITGNGGSGGGGTTINYAFLSDSTANSQINSLRIGNGAPIPTNATAPFLYIPACAGVPTGVPLYASNGAVALQYDSTNKKLMLYDPLTSTWKGVAVA